jgi:hypothetical protein
MECERLQRLVKSWYAQVQDEAMAPARMVLFMQTHIGECHTCLADPLVRQEIDKIGEIVLPPSKARPATKDKDEASDVFEEIEEEETEVGDESEDEELEEEELEDDDELDEI